MKLQDLKKDISSVMKLEIEQRKALTFYVNDRVLKTSTLTKNESLKQKFLDGDMIALDAEYHLKCLSKLYREAALHE